MVRKLSHSTAPQFELSFAHAQNHALSSALAPTRALRPRPRIGLLAFVSSLALAPACTLVVGDKPEREEDTGADASEHDAASEADAGSDAGTPEDSGSLDATSATDAAVVDAAPLDAGFDAGNDAGGMMTDSGAVDSAIIDAGPAPDCGTNMGSLWYPDGDEDGYGRSAEAVQTCARPADGKWATRGGDCKDNDSDVHPEQTRYFGTPYRAGSGSDSYDYDCSGREDGNPGQNTLANGCGLLELIACGGTGYLAGPRTGANVNAFCGSRNIGTCMAGALGLGCTTAQSMGEPYECK